jgi:hypothetical protein
MNCCCRNPWTRSALYLFAWVCSLHFAGAAYAQSQQAKLSLEQCQQAEAHSRSLAAFISITAPPSRSVVAMDQIALIVRGLPKNERFLKGSDAAVIMSLSGPAYIVEPERVAAPKEELSNKANFETDKVRIMLGLERNDSTEQKVVIRSLGAGSIRMVWTVISSGIGCPALELLPRQEIVVTSQETQQEQSIREDPKQECEVEQQTLGSAAKLLAVKTRGKSGLAPGEAIRISWDASRVKRLSAISRG